MACLKGSGYRADVQFVVGVVVVVGGGGGGDNIN